MPIVLNLRPFGNGKAHIGKDFGQLIHHLRDGMHRACGNFRRRQGHVQTLGRQACIKCGRLQRRLFRTDRRCYGFAQAIDRSTCGLTLFGRHLPQSLQQRRDAALLAQQVNADSLQRVQRRRRVNRAERVRI